MPKKQNSKVDLLPKLTITKKYGHNWIVIQETLAFPSFEIEETNNIPPHKLNDTYNTLYDVIQTPIRQDGGKEGLKTRSEIHHDVWETL